jgi:hypothetical protein
MLTLNLPAFVHKIKKKDDRLFIWDRIRKKYIVLQPEEWVRQHFIHYLIEVKKVPASLISLEYGQNYNTLSKRCDIVVWDADLKPLLLVECKASHVSIGEDVFFQASTYNTQLDVKFMVLTNGIVHHYFSKHISGFLVIDELPDYADMSFISEL